MARPPISGATRLAAVIGDPARHSLSPAIHNAGFDALGLDWVYLAFDVPRGSAADALVGVRALGVAGLSVTMPHKAEVAAAVDECSPSAAALRAVNCVINAGGRLRGENTDGDGFLRGLADDGGPDPAGASCVVLGAGGAARAVVDALARAGAGEVVVVNRSADGAARAAALAGDRGRVGTLDDLADARLVVNATPLGMTGPGADETPLPAASLHPGLFVADLVYEPARTPLLAACEARGVPAANGLSMLVHQAAVAFEHWTGERAPLGAMRTAALAALTARSR